MNVELGAWLMTMIIVEASVEPAIANNGMAKNIILEAPYGIRVSFKKSFAISIKF